MAVIEQNKSTSGWCSSIPTTEIFKHVTQATVCAKTTSSHTEKSGALLEGPLTVSPGMAGLFAPSPSCLDYNREQCCLMGKGIYGQQRAWWLVCKLSTLAAGISFPQTAENWRLQSALSSLYLLASHPRGCPLKVIAFGGEIRNPAGGVCSSKRDHKDGGVFS